MRTKLNLAGAVLILLALLMSRTSPAFGQEPPDGVACAADYTVQTSDSISTIAQKHYGSADAYQVIIDATNVAAQRDNKYTPIPDPNIISAGQVLCLPPQDAAQNLLTDRLNPAPVVAPPPSVPSQNPAQSSIQFSHEATVTQQPFQLTLSTPHNGTIYYTTNGSWPTPGSMPYTGPIAINQTTVIQAQVFDAAGNPVGEMQTNSYIIANYEQTIPVFSVVTDWSYLNALHANPQQRSREWERPINLEYFAPGGQRQFNVKAGIRIHGNFSRLFSPKKSYRLYFRQEYGGPEPIDYPFFEDTPVTTFDTLVLRAGFQDTFVHRNIPERADRHHTARYINDQVVRNLHRDMGQPTAHGRWVLLYLNGEFWGLYNLTEYIDLDFLRSYSEPEAEWDIIVKESGWENGVWYSREEMRDGGYGAWLENQNWMGSADFTKWESIGEWEWRVDKENFFSYMFLQAYVQHTDWPGANWVVYRRWDGGADGNEQKWRMMVWDTEDSFGGGEDNRVDMNTLERVYSPHDSITRILEKAFIGSCYLKNDFVQRAREYLGLENLNNRPANEVGQLSKERVKAEITRQADTVRPFIGLETQRWAPDLPGLDIFNQNIERSLHFADVREEVILEHLRILKDQTFTQCQ
jgi:hypothetical protein